MRKYTHTYMLTADGGLYFEAGKGCLTEGWERMRLLSKVRARICSKTNGRHTISFSKVYHLEGNERQNKTLTAVIPLVSRLSVTRPCCNVRHRIMHDSSVGHTGNWHVSGSHRFLGFIIRISIQSHGNIQQEMYLSSCPFSGWSGSVISLLGFQVPLLYWPVSSSRKVADVHFCALRLQHRVRPWNRTIALQLNF